MQKVQRKLALKIARAYRTVSFEAATVVAGIIPIHLLPRERKDVHQSAGLREAKIRARESTMEIWQEEWNHTNKGGWTRGLIPLIEPWFRRKHGTLDFYLSQAMTGHGCFNVYRHKIGKSEDSECWYCGSEDTPEHTLFVCVRWERERASLGMAIEEVMTSENMVEQMFKSKTKWYRITQFIKDIMKTKEQDERERFG